MVTDSLVVFVVRDGNPKKIKGWNDLVRPGVQVVTPNPFTSGGARWNVMAAYGAQRKLGQDRQAGAGLPAEAVQERRLAGQERPRLAADLQRRPRRRPARLRERGALRPLARPGLAVRDPALDDPDREPDRGRRRRASTSRRRTRSSASCARPTPSRRFAENGYRPVNKAVAKQFTTKFPARPGAVHDRPARTRRLGQGAEALLRPEHGDHGADRAAGRRCHRLSSAQVS